jgi:hypothetical protein
LWLPESALADDDHFASKIRAGTESVLTMKCTHSPCPYNFPYVLLQSAIGEETGSRKNAKKRKDRKGNIGQFDRVSEGKRNSQAFFTSKHK